LKSNHADIIRADVELEFAILVRDVLRLKNGLLLLAEDICGVRVCGGD
jgi:hypothetical protein